MERCAAHACVSALERLDKSGGGGEVTIKITLFC